MLKAAELTMLNPTRARIATKLALLALASCGPSHEEQLAAQRAQQARAEAQRVEQQQREQQEVQRRLQAAKRKLQSLNDYKLGQTTFRSFLADEIFYTNYLYFDARKKSLGEAEADVVLGLRADLWREGNEETERNLQKYFLVADVLEGEGGCLMVSPSFGERVSSLSTWGKECPPNVRKMFSSVDKASLGSVVGGWPMWLLQFRDGVLRKKEQL